MMISALQVRFLVSFGTSYATVYDLEDRMYAGKTVRKLFPTIKRRCAVSRSHFVFV